MIEASFSDVLEVILIILLVYFAFKLFIRWFGPVILKYFLKKVGKQFEKKFRQFDQTPEKSGGVTLEKKPGRRQRSNKDAGEYIDYEEIE